MTRADNRKRLTFVLILVTAYMLAEVVGGLLTNSLALLADAGHMLSDAGALALSIFAIWVAHRPPTPRRSYGYYRTEILAALVNGATLVAVAIVIFIEALDRFRDPPDVQGALVMGIATGGLLANLLGLWILNKGRSGSLNTRGAWLHVLSDALGSIGAILGGFLIWAFRWSWADPAVSVLIGFLVIFSSWSLLKETVAVLMESAPSKIDVDQVRNVLAGVRSVTGVHDLHIWSITSGMVSLSVHISVQQGTDSDTVLAIARDRLRQRFGIDHCTVQIERDALKEATVHA